MVQGIQLCLFTTLQNGPWTAEGMADTSGVGSGKLNLLLYALLAAELVTVEEELFANTIESDHYLVICAADTSFTLTHGMMCCALQNRS